MESVEDPRNNKRGKQKTPKEVTRSKKKNWMYIFCSVPGATKEPMNIDNFDLFDEYVAT